MLSGSSDRLKQRLSELLDMTGAVHVRCTPAWRLSTLLLASRKSQYTFQNFNASPVIARTQSLTALPRYFDHDRYTSETPAGHRSRPASPENLWELERGSGSRHIQCQRNRCCCSCNPRWLHTHPPTTTAALRTNLHETSRPVFRQAEY